MTNHAGAYPRQGLGAVTGLSLALLLLSIGAALGASAVGENDIVAGSVMAALLLEFPSFVLVILWANTRGGWSGWIAMTLVAAVGIVVIWLIYPVEGVCSAVLGDECPDDPRLQPALIGTIVIAGLWSIGTILLVLPTRGRSSRLWRRLIAVVLAAAVVYFPVATLASGGFTIPWW